MNAARSSAVTLALATVLLCAAVTGVAAAPAHDERSVAQQSPPETATAANNTTVRHTNPNETEREGEETLSELRQQLAGRLADRLAESSLRVSQEQYSRARELLGEEYLDTLEKYADVAEEQGNEETANELEQAGRIQRNFTDSVQAYHNTREEFREAKQEGNDGEARRLARKLDGIAQRIDRQSTQLNRTYTQLETDTTAEFSQPQTQIASISERVATSNAEIQRTALVETTLSVQTTSRDASFTDPLSIDGQVMAANGTALSSQTIDIAIGNREYTVQTDTNGSFTVSYRPITLPLTATSVDVRYVPDPTSMYVASKQSIPIAVEQVTATIDFESIPDRVAYDEPVAVTGRVRLDNRSIPNLSTLIRLDSESIGRDRTDGAGRFAIQEPLPAAVNDGTQSIRVLGGTDRAVAVSATSDRVTVASTPTNLTISLSEDETSIVAAGRLTANGDGVAGRQLVVMVGGTAIERTTTNERGVYRVRLDSEAVSENSVVRIRFDSGETNLESSNASTSFQTAPRASGGDGAVFESDGVLFGLVGGDGGAGGVGGDGSAGGAGANSGDAAPVPGQSNSSAGASVEDVTVGGAIAVVILAAGWYVLRRWRRDEEVVTPTETADSDTDTAVDTGPSPLELLTEGRVQDALLSAYQSVQRSLLPQLENSESTMTHRRFYQVCLSSNAVPTEALETLNDAYEQAVYSDRNVSFEQARDAILAARRLVMETSNGRGKS